MRIEGPAGTFGFDVYTEEEVLAMRAHDEAQADVIAAWQLDDDIQYHSNLAISYPQDIYARAANDWLDRMGV